MDYWPDKPLPRMMKWSHQPHSPRGLSLVTLRCSQTRWKSLLVSRTLCLCQLRNQVLQRFPNVSENRVWVDIIIWCHGRKNWWSCFRSLFISWYLCSDQFPFLGHRVMAKRHLGDMMLRVRIVFYLSVHWTMMWSASRLACVVAPKIARYLFL